MKLIRFFLIVTISLLIGRINTFDKDHVDLILKEHLKQNSIAEFCAGKVQRDFCSMEHRKMITQLLETQRNEVMRRLEKKRLTKMERVATILNRFKLKIFMAKYPSFKYMNDFFPTRFFWSIWLNNFAYLKTYISTTLLIIINAWCFFYLKQFKVNYWYRFFRIKPNVFK